MLVSSTRHSFICVIIIFSISVFFSAPVYAQGKKQLTPAAKAVKTGLIDQLRLRKEYKAYDAAREKLAKENQAEKKSFDQQLLLIDKQTQKQLKQDSLKGGKGRAGIVQHADDRRSAINGSHQLAQKKRHQDRIALMQQYEQKIQAAIQAVMMEGGFTDVKPLSKDKEKDKAANGPGSIDITDLVLKKLN